MAKGKVRTRAGLVDPASPSSEPFRSLRLALQLRGEDGGRKAVLFTSAESGEGKSTVSVNYALSSALSMDDVLLIDGDLRRPTIHEIFGIDRSPGLVDVLATGSDVRDAAVAMPAFERLDVLPAGQPITRAGDIASSARMGWLLRQAMEQYSLVVMDSAPLLHAADAAGLASHAGVKVVLVVKRGARRRTIRKAVRRLELVEGDLAGVVLNREGDLVSYGY